VAYLLKARTVKLAETAITREWLCNTPVARECLSSRHMIATTDMHTMIEELLEAVVSVKSMPRLYNKDQLPLPV
jgi:hypothetical protein